MPKQCFNVIDDYISRFPVIKGTLERKLFTDDVTIEISTF